MRVDFIIYFRAQSKRVSNHRVIRINFSTRVRKIVFTIFVLLFFRSIRGRIIGRQCAMQIGGDFCSKRRYELAGYLDYVDTGTL